MREETFADDVKKIKADLTEIKTAQRTGAGGPKGYEFVNPGAYDVNFVSNQRTTRYMVDMYFKYTEGYQVAEISWWASETGDPFTTFDPIHHFIWAQQQPPELGKTSWLVSFRNSSFPPEYTFGTTSYNVKVKFLLYTTAEIDHVDITLVP